MTPEEAKQHFEQIREETLKEDSRSLRAALKLLAEELNTKETHFILELLQNAEDNEYGGKQPELTLRIEAEDPTGISLSDGCLVVLNNEVGFQPENVRSLCSVGQSTKKNRNNGYIGEKGIGFKSVFRVTDSPHIFSNGFQFRFHVPTESEGFGYILPHWVKDVPPVVGEGFTAILLPLQPGKRELIAGQLSRIAPETILFLTKLKRLAVAEGRSISRDDWKGSLVTLRSNDENSLYLVHSKPCDKPHDLTEEKRPDISQRKVTIAFPLKTSTACNGRIFAFLPTEFDSGLPFLVNADFILKSDRERVLEDRRWNQWLRDEIAPTFVQAFLSVLGNADWKIEAHRFLPELAPAANFVRPVVESIHSQLQSKSCVLTDALQTELPAKVFVPGSLSRRILSDAPKERLKFALLHPSWENRWHERLKPLGVQSLTFAQLFEACNDDSWLKNRDAEWWETLFELCTKCDVSAATIGSFPILRCRDGICRPVSCGVFSNAEDQPTPAVIPSDWPPAHVLDADLQKRLQQKPAVWAWLANVAGLRQFSVQSYITDKLLGWMGGQSGKQLVDATRFIAANLKHFEVHSEPAWRQRLRGNQASQTVCEKIPWLLTDGRVVLPEQRSGKQLVTPECLEGSSGWNLLFCALDRHFLVLNNDYCDGLASEALSEMQELFRKCDVTAFPNPQLRELDAHDAHYEQVFSRCVPHIAYGTPRLRDWASPGWLLGLGNVEQTVNGLNKIAALERWLKERKSTVEGFMHCSAKQDYEDNWQPLGAWSEFGGALRDRTWLHTTKGYVKPPTAFLDTPEFRAFFGDSVCYVTADIPPALLEKLGVRIHLTAGILIGLLREMSLGQNPDHASLVKIYRLLQGSDFGGSVFRQEKLIFLSEPKQRWLTTDKLVWEDAGQLFDEDFGCLSLAGNYGNSELRQFFTEKLNVPLEPALKQYAEAWKNLCVEPPSDRAIVERKLKVILTRLADSQDDLSNADWWREIKPQLRVWTIAGEFQPPAQVYLPDHSVAVELFAGAGRINVAFPQKPSRTVSGFLHWMSCASLAGAVQPRLAGAMSESPRTEEAYLTPAAKELCVSLVCSHQGWQDCQSRLHSLLETTECGVSTMTVEYFLPSNPGAGTQQQSRDAYWDVEHRRLLLRDGVDSESLRGAAAKSIATEFFGEAASADMQTEFFWLLTVSVERARELMRERNNWRLSSEQQEWLREQDWQILITELDEIEQPLPPRPPMTPAPPNTTPTAPAAATSQQSTANRATATAPRAASSTDQPAPVMPGQPKQETPRSDHADTGTTNQDVQQDSQPASETPIELHDASTTAAEFIPVRAHTRSRPQRPRSQQPQENRREAASGLSSTSAENKADLETCARNFAARKLKEDLRYTTVEQMGQGNPGFDLRAVKPGHTLKVELKSHAREASSVFITQREYEEYQTTLGRGGEAWELWNVENLAKSSGKTPTIQRIGHIPESATKENGYWVDLRQCSHEPPTSGTADPQ
jgi:hypothetical protein